jgi:tetratricopeptide (TPR) repeat protein
MSGDQGGETRNTISGGIQYGPVLQFQNLINPTFAIAPAPVALAQLPPLVPGFIGREAELAMMEGLLDPAGAAGAVVVSAVAGLAGVGKTALAVQAGHAARKRGWFAGGVLFVDLHGYDEAPVVPGQALDALLRALGMPGEHIPPGAEARAGLYRSALAEISDPVLVIADNASSEAQVRLLLPGPGPHRVVVTSRHTLAGLGARLLDVTILDQGAGVALLEAALRAARPDDDRISADREAAGRLAGSCGGLPLALQIVAALLKADPARGVSELAGELAAERGRLAVLRYDDGSGAGAPSVTAAFELSCRRLDETAARLLRVLPVNPGPDVSTATVAVLADVPEAEARRVLGQLVRAHLVDGIGGRWRMHDLLRLYAQQLSDAHADADGREQAMERLLGYYLHTADAADDHLRALPGMVVPADFASWDDALAWLDDERPNLVAAVAMAAETGPGRFALRLPIILGTYFHRRRRFDDMLTTTAMSLETARQLGDRDGEGRALSNLGSALHEVHRFDEAIAACRDAVVIFRETGDRHREGGGLHNLGNSLREAGRFDEAIAACRDAAVIFRELGDRRVEGMVLTSLGAALAEAGLLDPAIAACRDATVIFRELDDRRLEGMALTNLGNCLREAGRFDEAITAHQGDLAICRELDDRYGQGVALDNLGLALREAGRVGEAIIAHRDAAAIYRELGDQDGESEALDNLATARATKVI